jgi:glycosyltransferase involved in cell wall biosynthesis
LLRLVTGATRRITFVAVRGKGLRLALVRGKSLSKWEMQSYEPLIGHADVSAFASTKPLFSLDDIALDVRRLHGPDPYLTRYRLLRGSLGRELWSRVGLDYLIGLEHATEGFDILHGAETNTGYTYQLARIRPHRPRARLVSTCWETIPFVEFKEPIIHRRRRFVQSRIDLFLAMTQRAADALRAEGVEEKRIRVQYPGINLGQFRPLPRSTSSEQGLWQHPDSLRVLFVGSITFGKGVRELLRAAAEVVASPRLAGRVEFGVVGNGNFNELIPMMVSQFGLESSLRHVLRVAYADMPALYASADLFVLPSIPTPAWEEQFGLVLAESMACGKAVVTTISGAIPEVVGDAAVLVPAGDYQALAQAICDLLLDDKRRDRLGAAAAARTRELFDPEMFARNVLKIYEEVLDS